jgi:hypothetical protein
LLSPRDLYTPLRQGDPLVLNSRGSHDGMLSIARLKPGLSISQAAEEMSAIQAHLDQLYPEKDRGTGTTVVPLKRMVIGDVPTGAVANVLLRIPIQVIARGPDNVHSSESTNPIVASAHGALIYLDLPVYPRTGRRQKSRNRR